MNRMRMAALGLGAAGFGLRWSLYRFFLDEKSLLKPSPLTVVLVALTALALALAVWNTRRQETTPVPGTWTAAGRILFGVGLGVTAIWFPGGGTAVLHIPARVLCLLCGGGMVVYGVQGSRGKMGRFGVHAVTALFLGLFLIYRYQSWSYQPQIMNYVYPLLGCICLCLTAYWHTAYACGMGKAMPLRFLVPAGIFLCLTAAARESAPFLYLTGALWLASSPEREQSDDADET